MITYRNSGEQKLNVESVSLRRTVLNRVHETAQTNLLRCRLTR